MHCFLEHGGSLSQKHAAVLPSGLKCTLRIFMGREQPAVRGIFTWHRLHPMNWDLMPVFRMLPTLRLPKAFSSVYRQWMCSCLPYCWGYMLLQNLNPIKMTIMTSPAFRINKETKKISAWRFILHELKPRGKWLTPFNIISIPIILTGIVLMGIRFVYGLGAVSNVTQDIPWGLWKGFNVVTGVAFAGGAYVLTFIVYILKVEKFHAIIRVTVLNGFLAYLFYTFALVLDLGKPWNIFNPIIGNNFGANSVLFLVSWHFLLYILAQLMEFSPAIAEWLGSKRAHRILSGLTVGAIIFD